MTCTFFGHRNSPQTLEPILKATLTDLIENKNVNTFYVGNQGNFDCMVRKILKTLKNQYPHIAYAVVLAYMPTKRKEYEDYSDTIFPDGLENTPPKFAISKRNRWMLNRADYVVTYSTLSAGAVAQFKNLAQKKGKAVINLFDE
ncbi:MAG: hypothetical protein IJO29_06980 [Oscillospiraceae bacterium]|nr:hypothetical protein [Oscillospiraceae bacterium]